MDCLLIAANLLFLLVISGGDCKSDGRG